MAEHAGVQQHVLHVPPPLQLRGEPVAELGQRLLGLALGLQRSHLGLELPHGDEGALVAAEQRQEGLVGALSRQEEALGGEVGYGERLLLDW